MFGRKKDPAEKARREAARDEIDRLMYLDLLREQNVRYDAGKTEAELQELSRIYIQMSPQGRSYVRNSLRLERTPPKGDGS